MSRKPPGKKPPLKKPPLRAKSSPKMEALHTKIDAVEAAHFAQLRDRAQQDKATAKALAQRRRPTWSNAKSSAKPASKKRRPS